jgi:CDK inhibitor PHO81
MPALIKTIKESGLILASFGDANGDFKSVKKQEENGVDATIYNNILRYTAAAQ